MKKGVCRNCEFCFPNEKLGFICADKNYGQPINDSLDEVKDCYSEGFEAFCERLDEEAIHYDNKPLKDIKIDGRKLILLQDREGKTIEIKASKAKKELGDIPVTRVIDGDTCEVNVVFDNKIFCGEKYIILK